MTASDVEATVRRVAEVLRGRRWVVTREADLQRAIADAFDGAGIGYQREVLLGRGRVDFLVAGEVVVEVKMRGGQLALMQQVGHYAEEDSVSAVVAAVTRRTLLFPATTICGRPVEAVLLPTL